MLKFQDASKMLKFRDAQVSDPQDDQVCYNGASLASHLTSVSMCSALDAGNNAKRTSCVHEVAIPDGWEGDMEALNAPTYTGERAKEYEFVLDAFQAGPNTARS